MTFRVNDTQREWHSELVRCCLSADVFHQPFQEWMSSREGGNRLFSVFNEQGTLLGVLSLSSPRGPCLPSYSWKCAERFKLSSLDRALLSGWKCYHWAGHIPTCLSHAQKTLIYSVKICSKMKCHEKAILTYHNACYTHLFWDHQTVTFVNDNELLWTSYCS